MKVIQRICLVVVVGLAVRADAQSPPDPANTSAQAARATEAPAAAASPSSSVSIEPPSLIPPNTLPGPGAGSLPQAPLAPELEILNSFFKQTSLGKAADEHRLHVQMADLEMHLRNDDELHALKVSAGVAPTDLERRHRLKTYYQAYFKKLRARATTPDLKAYLDMQEATRELLLLQPRVRHETDEAESATLAQARAGATAAPAVLKPAQAPVNNIFRP